MLDLVVIVLDKAKLFEVAVFDLPVLLVNEEPDLPLREDVKEEPDLLVDEVPAVSEEPTFALDVLVKLEPDLAELLKLLVNVDPDLPVEL
jgi:hypothetical protein